MIRAAGTVFGQQAWHLIGSEAGFRKQPIRQGREAAIEPTRHWNRQTPFFPLDDGLGDQAPRRIL